MKITGNNFNYAYPKNTKAYGDIATNHISSSNSSMPTNILLPSEGNLFTNKTGNYRYAEDSTKANPIVLIEGFDENGDKFQKKININDINPYDATEQEMTALAVHSGKLTDIKSSFEGALPLDRPNLAPNERTNFIALFGKSITDQQTLGNHRLAINLKSNMDFYISFWADRK